jgi:hypothetical protein
MRLSVQEIGISSGRPPVTIVMPPAVSSNHRREFLTERQRAFLQVVFAAAQESGGLATEESWLSYARGGPLYRQLQDRGLISRGALLRSLKERGLIIMRNERNALEKQCQVIQLTPAGRTQVLAPTPELRLCGDGCGKPVTLLGSDYLPGHYANTDTAKLRFAQARGMGKSRAAFLDRRAPAGRRPVRSNQKLMDVAFGQDALGQRVFQLGSLDHAADVEGQVAEAVAEAEQRFHRRNLARTRSGGEVLEGIHPGLDVADGHRAQRFSHEREETSRISAVGALGVRAATVEPELEQLGVAVDLGDGRQCVRGKRPVRRTNYVEHKRQKPSYRNVRVAGLSYIRSSRVAKSSNADTKRFPE